MKQEEYISELGLSLRRLRVEHNLSQEKLAHRVGVTRQTIAKIENGQGGQVSFDTWNAICDYFGFKFELCKITLTAKAVHNDKSDGLAQKIYGNYKGWS